ncbi:hypothetical protein H181DRAFT_05659, partial [Streptomyces sp. WMMB 714]
CRVVARGVWGWVAVVAPRRPASDRPWHTHNQPAGDGVVRCRSQQGFLTSLALAQFPAE